MCNDNNLIIKYMPNMLITNNTDLNTIKINNLVYS